MNKIIIANVLFIAYCIGLVVALTSVNTELKTAIEAKPRGYTTIKVYEGTGYQREADQYFLQRGLNFEPSTGEMVQQTPLNRWTNVQRTRNNYSNPVQKTAQMWQGQLLTAELTR